MESKLGQTLNEPITDTSESGPGTMEESLSEQPSRPVNPWEGNLGSFEEITTDTLSSAQLANPGTALQRLVALPSGVTIGRRPSRTPPKRRTQPTPKKATPKTSKLKAEPKIEPKMEVDWTPIKQKGKLLKEEGGQAQSTPKVKKEVSFQLEKSKEVDKSGPKTNKKKKSKIPVPTEDQRRSNRQSVKDVKPGKYAGTCKR